MTIDHISARWRQIVAATLFISAAGLGCAAAAAAQPNNGGGTSGEWDIGVYDSCLQHHPPYHSDDDKLDWYIQCCYQSGGVWSSGGKCTAPPAEASSPTGPGPTRVSVPPNMSAPSTPPNASTSPAQVSGAGMAVQG
ncbi:MAG: hypothetical protein JWQ31_2154 [Mycobacterium sp.]|nr:hypothetical protein [Mycobacterium sp.]